MHKYFYIVKYASSSRYGTEYQKDVGIFLSRDEAMSYCEQANSWLRDKNLFADNYTKSETQNKIVYDGVEIIVSHEGGEFYWKGVQVKSAFA
jgi:hypothetical protein